MKKWVLASLFVVFTLIAVLPSHVRAAVIDDLKIVLLGYAKTPLTSDKNGDQKVNIVDAAQVIKGGTPSVTPRPMTSTPVPPSPTSGGGSGVQPAYPPAGTTWTLKFNDDFNGTNYDHSKWNKCHAYTDGLSECIGDWYDVNYMATTDKSISVGPTTDPVTGQTLNVLKLWALKEQVSYANNPWGNSSKKYYQAGSVTTVGPSNVYTFQRGYIEAKARLPVKSGLDPAIWTMAYDDHLHDSWPLGGEVDLIEQKGYKDTYDVAVICGNTPHQGTWDLSSVYAANKSPLNKPVDGAFHIYSMYWTSSSVKIYLDGNLVGQSGSICNSFVPSYKPHYILLTMLMGTSGSGAPNTSDVYNVAGLGDVFGVMEVDYVRVWQ